ncbi:beta-1,3-glucanase [Blumeria hordei DH14]|uniref:Beta-1,3-glucanase n=1 Tax=Blumeria graminis f. sp. hordei (strain DH14) TaxID=546991 RepID=N1JM50_BLUG1|nr:beta-1,3-glucanase [Blumeria hordei DH14]
MFIGSVLRRIFRAIKATIWYNTVPQEPIESTTEPKVLTLSQPNPTYWHPNLHSDQSVEKYFVQETGDGTCQLDHSQLYTTSPKNSFFTPDHKLIVRAISQPDLSVNKYTSACLVSRQKLARDKGCVTAWLTVPCATGTWPAFWLRPARPYNWPADGEVKICEIWNGNALNHSCIHWGHYSDEDKEKHKIIKTYLQKTPVMHKFSFVWEQAPGGVGGRMLWYIDECPVMRASIPDSIRPMRDFQIILNVAMGGNICQDQMPEEGVYDLVVHDLKLMDEPQGGWAVFNRDWEREIEGRPWE